MKKIIGYTDSITECECCGKNNLKGTFCIELDGVELYYGSVCAFKSHGLTTDEQKDLKVTFTKEKKNKKLYDLHIVPIKEQLEVRLQNSFTTTYENLTDLAKKIHREIENDYKRLIEAKAKKYKINIGETV